MNECKADQLAVNTGTMVVDITPITADGRLVAHEYNLNLVVEGKRQAGQKCDDRLSAEATIIKVRIPTSTNIPALVGEVDVNALNSGLAHAGNQRTFDPKLVREARACFSDNLARSMVELTRADHAYVTSEETQMTPKGTLSAAFGNDVLATPNIQGQVTLASLDTIANIIQYGIASCKAGKGR